MGGMARQRKHEAAGHTAHSQETQRGECWDSLAFPLYPLMMSPIFKAGLPAWIKALWRCSHGHAQKLVSWEILSFATLTIMMNQTYNSLGDDSPKCVPPAQTSGLTSLVTCPGAFPVPLFACSVGIFIWQVQNLAILHPTLFLSRKFPSANSNTNSSG